MKIFFHIGLHKTASGTLQRQFFPSCPDLNLLTTQQKHTAEFVRAITRQDPIYFQAGRAREDLAPHLSDHLVNLVSNESISGPPYGGLVEHGLDHRDSVLGNLKSTFPEASILIVIRRQDSLARSLYRQYLKRGGTVRIDRFYGLTKGRRPPLMSLDRFRFFPYLNRLTELFPSATKVLLFEEFVHQREEFLRQLCNYLQIGFPTVALRVENSSRLGPIGMELSRIMNHMFYGMITKGPLPPVPRKQFGKWSFVSPIEYLHDYWPGSGRPGRLVQTVCDLILQEVESDNMQVDQRFNLGLGRFGYY